MKKLMIFLLLLSICLWSYPLHTYAIEDSLEIRVNTTNVLLNGTMTVDIIAKDIGGIAGIDIVLNYDQTKLDLESKTISIDAQNIIDVQKQTTTLGDPTGKVKVVFGLKKDRTLLSGENTTLATLQFRAISLGTTTLSFDSASQLIEESSTEQGAAYTYTNPSLSDAVTINIYQKASIGGKVTLSDGTSPAGTKVSLIRENAELESTTTDADGNYAFANIEDGDYVIQFSKPGYETKDQMIRVENGQAYETNMILQRIKEDVDRDGLVSLKDLVFIGSNFGLISGEEGWSEDADINKDDKIDMLDILYVSRKID